MPTNAEKTTTRPVPIHSCSSAMSFARRAYRWASARDISVFGDGKLGRSQVGQGRSATRFCCSVIPAKYGTLRLLALRRRSPRWTSTSRSISESTSAMKAMSRLSLDGSRVTTTNASTAMMLRTAAQAVWEPSADPIWSRTRPEGPANVPMPQVPAKTRIMKISARAASEAETSDASGRSSALSSSGRAACTTARTTTARGTRRNTEESPHNVLAVTKEPCPIATVRPFLRVVNAMPGTLSTPTDTSTRACSVADSIDDPAGVARDMARWPATVGISAVCSWPIEGVLAVG